jgi:hypothetical protein
VYTHCRGDTGTDLNMLLRIGMGSMSSPILNRVLVGKRPLGRPMSSCEYNIKMD